MTRKPMRMICSLDEDHRPRHVSLFIALLLIVAPFAGPAGAQQETPVVENGRNGSMRTAPTLTEKTTAGMEGPEESLLYQPTGLVFGPDGNLYVPDSGNKAVMVYRLDGRFVRRIGQEGAGPGEMRSPMGIYFDAKDELVVPDGMNQRTSYFSTNGEFLRSEAMGQNGVIVIGPSRIPLGDGTYIQAGRGGGMMMMVRMEGGSGGPPAIPNPDPIQILDESGKVIREFGVKKEHEEPRVAGMLNTASLAVDRMNGKAALAYRYTSDMAVYDIASGTLDLIISRGLSFAPREPKMDEVTSTGPNGGTSVRIAMVADVVTRDAAYDPQGRLWTITTLLGEEARQQKEEDGDYADLVRLEVYDRSGKLLTTIPLSDPADRLAFDPNGDLWLLDSLYLGTLKKYEVRWP